MAHRIHFKDIKSYSIKNLPVKRAVQEVFKNFRYNYSVFKRVTDQDLISLNALFGETFERALEIVEEKKVTFFYTKSNNYGIYQVEGSSCRTYTIYPFINYCSCPSYKYKVTGGSSTICKHVLATVVSDVTGKRQSIETSDEHFRDLILESSLQLIKMNSRLREDWQNENRYLHHSVLHPPMIPPTTFNAHPIQSIPSSNWTQIPPQTMPWGTPAMSQPSVVRFTAGNFNVPSPSTKRKSDSSDNMVPAKILVTEEKMAAHLRSLHISDVEPQKVASSITCKDEPMEPEKLPRLVISKEIKNFKTEPLIPESILKRLEKPEMALVLWQPPPADLTSRLKELKKLSKVKEKQNDGEKDECVDTIGGEMDVENKEYDKTIDVEMENNTQTLFRPINPDQMPLMPPQYFQPVPQFHGFASFNNSSAPY